MPKAQKSLDKISQAKNLAQAISAWTSSCQGIKKAQAGIQNSYQSHAKALSCAEINFPEYTERGTFYRGISKPISELRGLSSDQKTFVSNSCQCASRLQTVANNFNCYEGTILIFKNCLAIDVQLVLESNGFSYHHKSEKEMIIPAYQSFKVISIVGNYITLEESE